MTDYFTADLALSDSRVARARGFTSTAEHDSLILDSLTEQMADGDRLFILGHLTGPDENWAMSLSRLAHRAQCHNWTVYTILGPTDKGHPSNLTESRKFYGDYQKLSHYVGTLTALRLADTTVVASAVAYTACNDPVDDLYGTWRVPDAGGPLIHGDHLAHVNPDADPLTNAPGTPAITRSIHDSVQLNVSLDVTGYKLVPKQAIDAAVRNERHADEARALAASR